VTQTSTTRIAALARRARTAFAGVVRPSGVPIAPHECEQCEALRDALSGETWESLSAEKLEANYDQLPLLGPEALPVYLPAYLLYALEHFGPDDNVTEFTIYHLAPHHETTDHDYYRDRLRQFTAEQFGVIEDFLQLVIEDERFRRDFGGLIAGRDRLRELWRARWE
jgi:hypothetical protein